MHDHSLQNKDSIFPFTLESQADACDFLFGKGRNIMMSKKEQSIEILRKNIKIFKCPICHSAVKIWEQKSVVCLNNHTFDVAKQGYVNMMAQSSNKYYDQKLFAARQELTNNSDVYTFFHKKIADIVEDSLNNPKKNILLDAGCGEGSHLQNILGGGHHDLTTAVGVDIAKEGIVKAAKTDSNSTWLVGDIANIPLVDGSCHVVLNILSPSNYTEFKRVLAPEGRVVKVVPQANYFRELREVFLPDRVTYRNMETVSLFQQHFHLLKRDRIKYTKAVNREELKNVVHMSPLSWHVGKQQWQTLINQDSFEITIDVDVLVGTHKRENGGDMTWN